MSYTSVLSELSLPNESEVQTAFECTVYTVCTECLPAVLLGDFNIIFADFFFFF